MDYLSKPCPNCGTATVHSTVAGGQGAIALAGKEVKRGERVHVCDSCGVVVSTHGKPGASKKGSAAKKKSAKRSSSKPPARRSAKKSPRRPAGKKSARRPAGKKSSPKGGRHGH